MGILSKIFGAPKIIDAGINAIDAMVFTDEEKSKAKITLLKAYEPFKLAQRWLAIGFTTLFGMAFYAALIMSILEMPIEPVLKVVAAFSIGEVMMIIIGFYFLGGVTTHFKKS